MSLDRNNLPLIIQPEEFSEFLESSENKNDIRIVDLSSEANFLRGHIPGAIYLPFSSLMLGQPPAPGKIPNKERLQDVFKYLGLNENTHFFVVDDEGGGWAARLIWTLDVIGHKSFSYVDGGMLAWKAAGLATESGTPENPYSTESVPPFEVDQNKIAQLSEIMSGLGKNEFTVWDARSPAEHSGMKALAEKAGHIPGAINAEWTSLMDTRNGYRIRKDAKEYLDSIGIDGSLPIITHCQSHHRSAFTYLVGKSLGFDIRGYDGSWSEWGNHPDTPVEA
ncbi:MAG: sulfurtransferase [Agarilytica sp.]